MCRAARNLLLLALIAFVASLVASLVQTAGGRVQVQSVRLPTQNGQWLVADLFKPRTASAEQPAPLVIVVPGFQRSKEALSNIALELARRGMVAISIDPYSQGGSSTSLSRYSATTEGYGLFAVIDFAANTGILNYVDESRIGATGHSAGGNAVIRAASHFGREAQLRAQASKLQAAFVSGYVLTLTDEVLRDVRSNVGMSYALYDEGAYRNELQNADMRTAPEALRLVNSGFVSGEADVTTIAIGHYYGDATSRTLRVVYNEAVLHPFQPYLREDITNQIEFFETAFAYHSDLARGDQIWIWKELCSLIALLATMLALLPLVQLLLRMPLFRALAHAQPPAPPVPRGKGRLVFWLLFVTGALVACFSYIPLAELSQALFVDASTRVATWFFPQRMNNAVMLWALLNGIVGYLLFFLSYRYFGKAHGVSPEMWGASTSATELLRCLALALMVFVIYYAFLFAIYFLLHVDYRFLFMGVRVFRAEELLLLCLYAPFFYIFFLSNSLRVNAAMRFSQQAEWRSLLLAGLANSLGLMLIVVVQYSSFALSGTVYWTDGWLYVNLLFAVVPMMFVLPYFHRYFFRMTGRIYLGPMVTCLVFIMILLTNTVVYLPL